MLIGIISNMWVFVGIFVVSERKRKGCDEAMPPEECRNQKQKNKSAVWGPGVHFTLSIPAAVAALYLRRTSLGIDFVLEMIASRLGKS